MAALDAERILELCRGNPFVRRIVTLDETPSTNDDAQRLAADGAPEGTVVLADRQSAGRGRFARAWHSPPGLGLYVSVVLRPALPLRQWTRWTIASAVASCEACREISEAEVAIKWPNDLLIAGRKVGGILAELRSMSGAASALVVGVGINVNHRLDDFPAELKERATSLRIAAPGKVLDRAPLAAAYLCRLGAIADLLARGSWSEVTRAWSRRAPGGEGRRVRVVCDPTLARSFDGVSRGLDNEGALRVERPEGDVVSVRFGESVIDLEA